MYDDDYETCPGHLVVRHMARDDGWVLITDGTANSAVSIIGGALWTRDELELDDHHRTEVRALVLPVEPSDLVQSSLWDCRIHSIHLSGAANR